MPKFNAQSTFDKKDKLFGMRPVGMAIAVNSQEVQEKYSLICVDFGTQSGIGLYLFEKLVKLVKRPFVEHLCVWN